MLLLTLIQAKIQAHFSESIGLSQQNCDCGTYLGYQALILTKWSPHEGIILAKWQLELCLV